MHCVHFCFRVGGFPRLQNGWAVALPKGRHASLPKVKGRKQGGDGVVEEVGGDDTCEQQGEVVPANLVCVVVGVGAPHHLLRVGGWPLVRRTGCARLVVLTSATTELGAFAYRPELAVNGRQWESR